MYKLMNGDLVIDILRKVQYVRYLPRSKSWVVTDKLSAHGVMSSDGSRIFLLNGRAHTCPDELKSVSLVAINAEEYANLAMTLAAKQHESEELKAEIDNLKSQLDAQNELLKAILEKL